jgi:hypothetical protein
MSEKQRERVIELLSDLISEGAEIKDSKSNSSLTKEAISTRASPDFEAWVTWTKSF